ncbi:MAG: OPT family oligopeptide transporter [Kofleriaceae bacterium]
MAEPIQPDLNEGAAPVLAPAVPLTEDPETIWLRDVYRPDEVNLTVRAVLVGAALGAVMCLSNLYVFFKTGWSMGVTLTACILAYAVFAAARPKRPLGMLENNALTTVASGAGYMTGGGNMAALGALLMVTSVRPEPIPLMLWLAVIATLGVFAAIPIKRQLINREALAFPTGTATAETIRSLHTQVQAGAPNKARALLYAGLFGAAIAWLRDGWKVVAGAWSPGIDLAGHSLMSWTISLKTEVVLLGAGALMSFRTGWSVLLGGVLTYVVLGPALLDQGLISGVTYKAIVAWTLWPGAAILVSSGLTSFLLDYKSLGRAFSGIAKILRRNRAAGPSEAISAVEAPDWWFPAAFMVLSPVVIFLMAIMFQIPVWAGVIAVVLAVLLGFVAARVTGDTDVTPTKALGPVTQMVFGAMTPGNLSGNIMSANVTGGIGLHAADLLTTLKTGWLLGAKPRHQLYAQLFGVLIGAVVVVPMFMLILPDPSVLGGDDWPAPSCVVWAGVSEAFANGLGSLHSSSRWAIAIGVALGACLAVLEKVSPPRARRFLPSASGIGIAMVVPCSNSISMFIGALTAEILRRRNPKVADAYVVPVASGLIAGESLMGVAVTILTTVVGVQLAL